MARTHVRQLWKARIEAAETRPGGVALANGAVLRPAAGASAAAAVSFSLQRTPFAGRVLGIDPSLRGTGLALVEFAPGTPSPLLLLRCETVRVPAAVPLAEALACIHRAVTALVGGGRIRHVALEQTIYVQNVRTAQILGAARGAAIAAAALHGLPVFEYPPLRVKEAVVGIGRASKEQVARTVMAHLGHARPLAHDEADAAAVALCHAFTHRE